MIRNKLRCKCMYSPVSHQFNLHTSFYSFIRSLHSLPSFFLVLSFLDHLNECSLLVFLIFFGFLACYVRFEFTFLDSVSISLSLSLSCTIPMNDTIVLCKSLSLSLSNSVSTFFHCHSYHIYLFLYISFLSFLFW